MIGTKSNDTVFVKKFNTSTGSEVPSGSPGWDKQCKAPGSAAAFGNAITLDGDGNIIAADSGTNLAGSTQKDFWAKKFQPNGTEKVEWEKNTTSQPKTTRS